MENNLLLHEEMGAFLQVVISRASRYYEERKHVVMARPAVVKTDNICQSSLQILILPVTSDGNHCLVI